MMKRTTKTARRGLRLLAVLTASAGVAVGLSALKPQDAAAAPCWSVFNSVKVDGGEASWTISCNNGTDARITGWVRDTKADGKCARIKAFSDNGKSQVPLAEACGKGTDKKFDWMAEGARDIRAYLWTG
jgi:hypothetical protein